MTSSLRKHNKLGPPEFTQAWSPRRQIPPWLIKSGMVCYAWDRSCTQWMHRITVWPSMVKLFRAVSSLSDGMIWLAVFPCLYLWGGSTELACMLRLLGMSAMNLLVYKVCKHSTGRHRPFKNCPGIRMCTAPLDEFSFPSGHTLHAVAFGVMLPAYHPALSWPLGIFALLVALSWVILGMHYPSDVVVGAAIGAISAWATLKLF